MAKKRTARETRASAEDPRVPVSAENFLQFFGVSTTHLPAVTLEAALQVPAFLSAVTFLSRTLANLPIHAFQQVPRGAKPLKNGVQALLNEAPNDEWTSFDWRNYHWNQVFTVGRGLSWIERKGDLVVGIWPIDANRTTIIRSENRVFYEFSGGNQRISARDVIDTPFMLRHNQLNAFSPLALGGKALQLALAMNDYASGFFAGGGVPPLALTGPLPAGAEAMKRAQADIKRAVDGAKASNDPVFPIPVGYKLEPVGFDPAKGQMVEARLFQIQEIARIFGLPPVFLQDLSRGTFANVEQQDLFFVKHLVAQWAKAFEDQLNLKLFGRGTKFYVEHSLDGLLRGDIVARMTALSHAVQNGLLTPDEGRALDNRAPRGGPADQLYIQGATVPLGSQPNGGANASGNADAQPQA